MATPVLTREHSFSSGVAGIDTANTPTKSSEDSSEYLEKINKLVESLRERNPGSSHMMKPEGTTTENKAIRPAIEQVDNTNSIPVSTIHQKVCQWTDLVWQASESSGHKVYSDRHGKQHVITLDLVPVVLASSEDREVMPSPQVCINSSSELSSNNRLKTWNRTNEICRNFMRGECLWGRRCRRVHLCRELQELESCGIEKKIIFTDATINEICRLFGEGRCSFGRNCHRIHVVNRQVPDTISNESKSDLSSCGGTPKITEHLAEKQPQIKEDPEFITPVVSLPTVSLRKPLPTNDAVSQPQAQPNTSVSVGPPSSSQADSVKSCSRRKAKTREVKPSSLAAPPLTPPGLAPPKSKNTPAGEPLTPPGLAPPRAKDKTAEVSVVSPGPVPPRSKGKDAEAPLVPPGLVPPRADTKPVELAAFNGSGDAEPSTSTSAKDRDSRPQSKAVSSRHSDLAFNLDSCCSWDCQTEVSAWFDSDTAVSVSDSCTFSSEPTIMSSTTSLCDEDKEKTQVRHPRPRNGQVCWRWLHGKCERAYDCRFVHENLDYDEPPVKTESTPKPTPPTATSQKAPSMFYTYTIHDHIKVKFAAGFAIQEITTGFESPWIYITNLPSHVTENDISYLLSRHGTVQDLRIIDLRSKGIHSARARFASNIEARNANASLNGSVQWGTMISTQLPVNTSVGRGATIQDTAVRIQWEAPSIVGFAGYPTIEQANRALEIAKAEYRDTYVSAVMHVGLPAVGKYTVRFMNLPLKTKEKHMKRYAEPADMMWNMPNYTSVENVVNKLKFILTSNRLELLTFDVLPPPYRDGRVRAWAYFSSAAQARAACGLLHLRKPACTGRTKVFAHHVQTLSYSIPLEEYRKIEADVFRFRRQLWEHGQKSTTLNVVVGESSSTVTAKLSGEDLRELGQLKAEFEKIRGGELVVVRKGEEEKEVVWDGFFGSYGGRTWLRQLEKMNEGVAIREDVFRRRLTLFGHPRGREAVKRKILERYAELNAREPRYVSLPGCMVGPFMRSKLASLQRMMGAENVSMDLWNHRLVIMGTKNDYHTAFSAVQEFRMPSSEKRRSAVTCPVCLGPAGEDGALVTLDKCTHTYCKSCLKGYLQASVENNAFFPITCLGDEARCEMPIPVSAARQVLAPAEFEAVVGAAFRSHIHSHTKEFHYCPSPDCMQVYRSAPEGNVLQCPACLVRICGKCHVEYHDGFDCPDRDGEERLFREWAEKHGVKRCPECKVPIERAEGCNHVTCTQCGTHICWVCMEVFPKGEGIYSHMRAEHGGIGLGMEEWY